MSRLKCISSTTCLLLILCAANVSSYHLTLLTVSDPQLPGAALSSNFPNNTEPSVYTTDILGTRPNLENSHGSLMNILLRLSITLQNFLSNLLLFITGEQKNSSSKLLDAETHPLTLKTSRGPNSSNPQTEAIKLDRRGEQVNKKEFQNVGNRNVPGKGQKNMEYGVDTGDFI